MATHNVRSDRLAKYFAAVIYGKQKVLNVNDVKRFLDAIFDQEDRCVAIERLIASEAALTALRNGLRFNITPAFINQYTARFVQYLNDPSIKQLCNGKFLEHLLTIILEPRTLWNAYLEAFNSRQLDQSATHALAWMTAELLLLPTSRGVNVTNDAQSIVDKGSLLLSPSVDTRHLGHKIKYLLEMKSSASTVNLSESTAGGRHDNDFPDFREIAILPTSDEFSCTDKPFYRRAEEILDIPGNQRVAAHVDNQFRLLREDMLSELRENVQIARGYKKGRRPAFRLGGLSVARLSCGGETKVRLQPCSLGVICQTGLSFFQRLPKQARKAYLQENRHFVKHQAFGCLIRGTEIVAFAVIERDIDALISNPPVIMLRIAGDEALKKSLLYLKLYNNVDFLLVDTPIFAYEPILKCLQEKMDFPLKEELFLYQRGQQMNYSDLVRGEVIVDIENKGDGNIQIIIGTSKAVKLDASQLDSLLTGLTKRVSLIQGPPGTGKSFLGAILAKVLHDHTREKILVMCYTNHALDQFLEDFLDIGIDQSAIIRLGAKSTPRTQPLSLSEQRSSYRRTRSSWDVIRTLELKAMELKDKLQSSFKAYQSFSGNYAAILDYLEYEHGEKEFYEAFTVAEEDDDGMIRVGEDGKPIGPTYLIDRWIRGKSTGVFEDLLPGNGKNVWKMDPPSRQEKYNNWLQTLLDEQAEDVKNHAGQFNQCRKKLDTVWNEKTREILKDKRIIGCTTTAAAKYAEDLRHIMPGIALVEEAGEILESHILTALAPESKQLVLIGDHLQLRPKINDYALSIEKGEGYDLNVSLFERLISAGYPHTTLLKQHRMCPEISTLVRHLTYPDLEDGASTKNRPRPLGLQDRVIFFQHEHPEVDFAEISDARDEGSKQSKRNVFEAEIVLQIVKYFGQQGYGTDKLVILTPYLGQLHLLQKILSKNNDPVLNDLDSYDLVKAGLLSVAGANHSKRRIRISTIDNYQGEESEIVIASLTRSNKNGEIGFMGAPERLNVLLSRARNVLIMVGNSQTFISSRKGSKCWGPLLDRLKSNGHIYDGLPVKCEQHPQTTAILKTKEDFETECPDGGCSAPCGVKLQCGIHDCPSKCHKLVDHSKMTCDKMVQWLCPRGHRCTQFCGNSRKACGFCVEEDREKARTHQRDLNLDSERERKQKEYARRLAEAQDEISHLKRVRRDEFEDAERARVLEQHWGELEGLKNPSKQENLPAEQDTQATACNGTARITRKQTAEEKHHPPDNESSTAQRQKTISKLSAAKNDWEYQKQFLNAQSVEIDKLMEMTGLESVKEKFMAIKSQVDTSIRQNVDLKDERYGSVLLGNPGTGKTTVARLYASFLANMGVIHGNTFIETTGSRLANDGVTGCQKILDKILNAGGGALFIDEAYQLAQGNSYCGAQVLDFLLAEVENLTGKIIFILAGYQRPMEKFFAHNPGLPSRFPHELKFNDYDDDELRRIFEYGVKKKYSDRMNIEGGFGGLYCRIVARRIGRGRGRDGFANARAVENTRSRIAERQSKRLAQEKRNRKAKVNDFLLTKEDLIGPEPARVLEQSSAWKKLKAMIGLDSVKKTVEALLDSVQYNYHRELQELPLVEFTLNKVFLGSPGTGKTTVAKLYGEILVDIGMLSSGEVVVKNPSDFVGSAMGESEKNTKGILAATQGKVLVIDEAYGLFAGGTSGGQGAHTDIYRTAVVDTIVAEVQSNPGADQCILLLGYKDQMQQMFQHVNPGLSRRFPIDDAFVFEDFTDVELDEILTLKLKQQGFNVTARGQRAAMEVLERSRNRPNFGNAGEVDIILNSAKISHQKRLSSLKRKPNDSESSTFDARDFGKDFDRAERKETKIATLFEGVVGCEEVIAKLESYRQMVQNLKKLDLDPRGQVPFNFLFRGPPGTGKTSTARKIGKVYYDMGLLASDEVVETSATDFIAPYVGQTGPKTQSKLESGLGKVLFIDEAYRLADGEYAKEAIDEIVDCITKPNFAQKLIIILAGYDADINQLMSINPGLTSRFPESIQFNSLSPADCIQLMTRLLQKKKGDLRGKSKGDFDLTCIECPTHDFSQQLTRRFDNLSNIASWANARDVETLVKGIFGKTLQALTGKTLVLKEATIIAELDAMAEERVKRQNVPSLQLLSAQNSAKCAKPPSANQSANATSTKSSNRSKSNANITHLDTQKTTNSFGATKQHPDPGPRDDGVSDAVWNQLQRDKAAAEAREKEYQRLKEIEDNQAKIVHNLKEDEAIATVKVEKAQRDGDYEARKRQEQARIQRELERREQEEILEKLRKQREEMEEMRRKEQQAQRKLAKIGVCVAGYRWIKQSAGYRCAGGSHWVSNSQLGI